MYFTTSVNDRPFKAIMSGKKTIEGRTIASWDPIDYRKVKVSDIIEFTNSHDIVSLEVKVTAITHYLNVREMLDKEQVEYLLSSGGTKEEGISNFNHVPEYIDNVPIYGIYAIRFELIRQKNKRS